ncbi:MAG: DNA-binding NarL/FixJ family response regulator [Arenicella sp.]|jgi:DNA-binding NarL/FixJ family response regulator
MRKSLLLVLDDSKVVCGLIQSMIEEKLQHDCVCFGSLEEVPKDVLAKVDLVILDYYFGTIAESENNNGVKYMMSLKRINPKISIIVFSGQKKDSLAIKMISMGAEYYIDKNSDNFIELLIKAVSNVIEFKKSVYK